MIVWDGFREGVPRLAVRRWAGAGLRLVAALAILAVAPAQAVILGTGTGTENTTAPPDDPGWANIGVPGALAVTYLGGGWVISARHVGLFDLNFGGTIIEPLPHTRTFFETSPGVPADLHVYRILSDPGLPDIDIATSTPPDGSEVLMIGRGRNRGAATSWGGYNGWLWGAGLVMRWGNNRITTSGQNIPDSVNPWSTVSIVTTFDLSGGTAFEAQGAVGDSGGPVFYKNGANWELVGVMYAINEHPGQPPQRALDQNETFIAEVAHYSADILTAVAGRACSDGVDDDGDGLIDYPADPGCDSAMDPFETDASLPCDDGFDNDGDLLRDSSDPGCRSPSWMREDPACDDGIDNDGDTGIDWDGGPGAGPIDPECVGRPWAVSELPPLCGLGFELVLVLPLLARLRLRRRRR